MKPFNLEAAKKGAALCTRDGRDARIICWDAEGDYPIIALIKLEGCEISREFAVDGVYKCFFEAYDLFIKSVKVTKWTNIYTNSEGMFFVKGVYENEEEAKNNIIKNQLISYKATSKIEYEE